jgi:BlaI family transcriptional regulator, penicillinase repressor
LFVRKISYLYPMKNAKSEGLKKFEPTKSELEILKVLWQHGPSTVRFVNDTLNQDQRPVQYTSTLKLMQIMVEKGILNRDERSMKHIYIAAQDKEKAKSLLLDRFVDSMFDGSASNLMMQLLGNKKTSKKELNAIRKLLDNLNETSSDI